MRTSGTRVSPNWRAGALPMGEDSRGGPQNIQEAAQMVIEDMLKDGEPIPKGVMIYEEPLVSVTV